VTESKSRKNILLIVVDQWRGDSLSCVGHPTVRTPNLDALAADATLFRRNYAQASPCGPGRASLLTGMYLMNHRVVRNSTPLDHRHEGLPNLLSRAGYDPALIGYTTTTPDPRQVPAAHRSYRVLGDTMGGFRPIVAYEPDKRPYLSYMERRGYTIPEPPLDLWMPREDPEGRQGWGPTFAPAPFPAEESDTAFFTEEALAYLRFQGRNPWFLHLGYWRPHPPFIAPAPYHAMYDPADVPAPARAETAEAEARQHPLLAFYLKTIQQKNFFRHGEGLAADLAEREIRQLRATYYGLLSEVDHHVGSVLTWLKETGQYDNTLIIFTCDHGEELGDHYLLGKQSYFDGSYHVPLIIRDPFAKGGHGTIVDAFTEGVDILPTLLAWLEQPVPRQCDGYSLLPFCSGETPAGWRTEVHYEYDFRDVPSEAPQRALGLQMDQCSLGVIQDRRYKYVHFAALPPLLFDLEEDPKQLHNLAGDPAYAPVMLEYAQKMLSWRMENMERTLTGMSGSPDGLVVRS
jgi:arylsulfatase A-like enzyme